MIFYSAKNIFTSKNGGEYVVSKKVCILMLAVSLVFTTILSISVIGNDEQSVVSAFSKKDKIGDVVTFSVSDFTSGIKGDNTLDAIVIAELPEAGNLFVGENTIKAGDVVYHSDLNNLTYSSDENVEISDFFTIIPVFSKTGSAEKVVITLSLTDRINYAPVAVNESYKTYADIKLKGTFPSMSTVPFLGSFVIVYTQSSPSVSIAENVPFNLISA